MDRTDHTGHETTGVRMDAKATRRGPAGEAGMALMSTLLVMVLMSALLVGFFALIAADQQSAGINRDQTQAYAAAHAGLEKLTSDLGALFTGGNYSPTTAQLAALTTTPPTLPGFQYVSPDGTSGYTITAQPTVVSTIPNGPFQGLQGLLTPYQINVTARASGGVLGGAAEVRMRRTVQTVAVPVFQFGMYSENDLSFFAGPDFDFGGRVHSNQNIYLAQDGSAALTLRDYVTAVGEIVRTHLANGLSLATSGHRGYVRVATTGGSNPPFKCLSCGSGIGGNCGGTPPAGVCTTSTGTATQEGSVNVASVPPSTLQTVSGVPTMVLVSGNTSNLPTWTNVSTGVFSNRIRNGLTGAKRLDLPLVTDGATPIDLVRRPSVTAPDAQVVLDQRFFKMASLRILLSDRAADITGLQTVTSTAPVNLAKLARDTAYQATLGVTLVNGIPLALAGTYNGANGYGYRVPPGTPIADGYLKIERQDRDGVWSDVTVEILNRGFTGRNIATGAWNTRGTTCATSANDDPSPNAVIRLQRVRDNPSIITGVGTYGYCGHASNAGAAGPWSSAPTDYLPLALYDAREGARRDDPTGAGTTPLIGGVMHYVELDVNNLRLWLATHADTQDLTGFVVYFSDRRGNKNLGTDGVAAPRAGVDGVLYNADDFGADDQETGELGFEDIINPANGQSVSNGTLDTGEDVNGNGVLDTYGGVARQYPTANTAYTLTNNAAWVGAHATVWPAGLAAAIQWPPALGYQPTVSGHASTESLWAAGTPVTLTTAVPANDARVNPPVFFRRAIKVVNGAYTSPSTLLRLPRNGTQGLSVVAENPLYVQGDYNGPNAAGTDFGATAGTDHVSAALIADAVTLLSNNFNDIGSFVAPHDVTNANRNATTTWYRTAVISGKGLNFPRPTSNTANDHTDFGTDGGAHNFLRYIEDWGGATLNYRGSIVSFYTNRQAVGIYKCCNVVYAPPDRGYKFDTDFLTPSLLPPRTPMFRDVNTLTFRQLLRPNQ
jgi:hypothetical protein